MSRTLSQHKNPSVSELKYIIETLFEIDFYKYITKETALDEAQKARLDAVIKDYSLGRPLEYILKKTKFGGLRLDIDESVLIPRPETELLVASVIKYIDVNPVSDILDVGTGSANIALTLSLARPEINIFAGDISLEALALAARNISDHKRANVFLAAGDCFSCFKPDSFDIIVSNPPYVETSYIDADSSLDFEPRIALDGGRDGLDIIRRILDQARLYLRSKGMLFLEIGYGQSEKVVEYSKLSGWRVIELVRDYAGIERVAVFRVKA